MAATCEGWLCGNDHRRRRGHSLSHRRASFPRALAERRARAADSDAGRAVHELASAALSFAAFVLYAMSRATRLRRPTAARRRGRPALSGSPVRAAAGSRECWTACRSCSALCISSSGTAECSPSFRRAGPRCCRLASQSAQHGWLFRCVARSPCGASLRLREASRLIDPASRCSPRCSSPSPRTCCSCPARR